jgi:hypothetical protein
MLFYVSDWGIVAEACGSLREVSGAARENGAFEIRNFSTFM